MIENCVTFLPVSDIEKTTTFYQDVIGLKKVQEQSGGMCRIFDTGYGYWGFCEYGDGRPIPSGMKGVCLSLNMHDEKDVDSMYERLISKGITTKTKPEVQKNFPVYAFFLSDPDGYKVEFQFIQLPDQQLMGGRKS